MVSIGSGRNSGRGDAADHRRSRARFRGEWRDTGDGALGDIALDGRETAKAIFSDTVRKDIDQVRNIRLRFLDQRGYGLPIRNGSTRIAAPVHRLNSRSRIDGVDLLAKQPRQTFCVLVAELAGDQRQRDVRLGQLHA